MLVMQPLVIAFGLMLVLGTAVAAGDVQDDPGAGPVVMRITPCLIANRTGQGAQCPEPSVSFSDNPVDRIASRLQRARFFADMQDLAKARDEVDIALGVDPADVKALHLSARLALTMGDTARAERDIDHARKLAPDDPDVRATFAAVLETRPATLMALREYHEIIQQYPHHRFAREQQARLLMEAGDYTRALPELDALVADNPDDVLLLTRRAEVFIALGRPEQAAADYSAALKFRPTDYMLLVNRADAFALAERDELALRDYNELLGSDPNRPRYAIADNRLGQLLMRRALVLARLRRFEAAADDMTQAISQGGKSSILRAEIFLRANGFPEIALDGVDSKSLRRAISSCFGLNACFQEIMRAI